VDEPDLTLGEAHERTDLEELEHRAFGNSADLDTHLEVTLPTFRTSRKAAR